MVLLIYNKYFIKTILSVLISSGETKRNYYFVDYVPSLIALICVFHV